LEKTTEPVQPPFFRTVRALMRETNCVWGGFAQEEEEEETKKG
jgi:hypothetical protein